MVFMPASDAMAAKPRCGLSVCGDLDGGGAYVGITDPGRSEDEGAPPAGAGEQVGISRPRSERTSTPGCPGNDPNTEAADDVSCTYLVTACFVQGLGPGPMTWIWSRPLDGAGNPTGRWVRTGLSCNVPPAATDAGPPRPALTIDLIRTAFREVDFAVPTLHVQPEGGVTLVNLPTYFEVQWPAEGFEPDEVATVTLLGRSVRIRPLSKTYTYRFGDGSDLGPTKDAGGPYPTGTVQHVYDDPAAPSADATATYGGLFSVDGGEWQDVGETVEIAGPATGVRVREARARLEAG